VQMALTLLALLILSSQTIAQENKDASEVNVEEPKIKLTEMKADGEESEKDDDPIVEDLSKVDFQSLPVLYKTRRRNKDYNCEYIEEDEITYSYDALTASGSRTEVHFRIIEPVPRSAIERSFVHDEDDSLVINQTLIPYLNCYQQDDQNLIKMLQEMIVKPSNEEYNFTYPLEDNINGEVGQSLEVDRLVFGGKLKNGFFIEAGASDSEHNSDTLHFEINHGWTGLMVEPNSLLFGSGLRKHRRVHSIQGCLSTQTTPQIVDFDMKGVWRDDEGESRSMGGIVTDNRNNSDMIKAQCFPLYSILLALDNPTVHYISLDVEGAEFAILQTIPWDKVDIQVLSVESHMLNDMFPGTREDMIEYMQSVGYRHIPGAHAGTNDIRQELGTIDEMFVKNGVTMQPTKDEL